MFIPDHCFPTRGTNEQVAVAVQIANWMIVNKRFRILHRILDWRERDRKGERERERGGGGGERLPPVPNLNLLVLLSRYTAALMAMPERSILP